MTMGAARKEIKILLSPVNLLLRLPIYSIFATIVGNYFQGINTISYASELFRIILYWLAFSATSFIIPYYVIVFFIFIFVYMSVLAFSFNNNLREPIEFNSDLSSAFYVAYFSLAPLLFALIVISQSTPSIEEYRMALLYYYESTIISNEEYQELMTNYVSYGARAPYFNTPIVNLTILLIYIPLGILSVNNYFGLTFEGLHRSTMTILCAWIFVWAADSVSEIIIDALHSAGAIEVSESSGTLDASFIRDIPIFVYPTHDGATTYDEHFCITTTRAANFRTDPNTEENNIVVTLESGHQLISVGESHDERWHYAGVRTNRNSLRYGFLHKSLAVYIDCQ